MANGLYDFGLRGRQSQRVADQRCLEIDLVLCCNTNRGYLVLRQ